MNRIPKPNHVLCRFKYAHFYCLDQRKKQKTKELNPQTLPAAAVDDPSVSVIFSAPLRID